MSKSDLLVMDEMAKNNQDIKCTTTVVNVQKVKAGAHLTFVIDGITGQQIMNDMACNGGEYVCIAYVINRKQYQLIKNQL